MGRLFKQRTDATEYTLVPQDTFEKIVDTKCEVVDPKITWEEVALYNWGTKEPTEVGRALVELLGVSKGDDPNPIKWELDPARGTGRKLLLPKVMKKEGLPFGKVNKLKVKQVKPPVAIRFETLSPWFIPGKENCDLTYSLEGLAVNATKVDLEVYGSHYCTAGDWNNGFVKFSGNADLKDTKIYENGEQTAAPERGQSLAIKEWKGKVTATAGALGKKNPSNEDRVINAAFSPYTAMLRYYKDGADKTARLDLDMFWPQFADNGDVQADSLRIRFAIRSTARIASTNGGGTLLVYDGLGALVYREAIALANLGQKDADFHEISWTGDYMSGKTNSAGTSKVIQADMPYRVEIQAHTGPDQANGLALAARATEVRLYVHPQTYLPSLNPYVPQTDQPSFAFRCHRDLLAVKSGIVRSDGDLWVRYQLARTGFHPGPVENPNATAFSCALKEFKRSVPPRRANPNQNFTRFALDASTGEDVKDAVENLAGQTIRQRPWFGDPGANRADFAFDDDNLNTRLNDPNGDLIVWVDDRHYYTDPGWLVNQGPKGTATRTKLIGDPAAMSNYALTYTGGDPVNEQKLIWIPRPWIPLAVSPTLLSKANGLADVLGTPSEADRKLMAKAIGPLRVDWTFDEIDADPPLETIVDQGMYSNQVTRRKLFLEHYRNSAAVKVTYARKDVNKSSVYSNAPDTANGVRPANTPDYFKVMFAQAGDSLKPWHAEPDSGKETVATIVHDNTGQADNSTFPTRFGLAGIYFRPSTIGGDGIRLRAQMRFKQLGDYKLPNLTTLEKLYPKLPQVQSAKIRVWRKASIRGYVSWGPNNSWGAQRAGMLRHYDAAYLHLVYELNDAAVGSTVTAYFNNDNAFRDLVKESVDTTGAASKQDKLRAKSANISLNNQRLWPWMAADHFGVFEPSTPNITRSAAVTEFYNIFVKYFYSLSNLYGLEFVRTIEKQSGKLRGHIVLEFQAGDDFYVQKYKCQSCNSKFFFVENQVGDSEFRKKCPAAGCNGKLGHDPMLRGHYTCTNGHTGVWDESTSAGGDYVGATCVTRGCGGTYNADQAPRVDYVCNKCNWTFQFSDNTGSSYVNEACYSGVCTGKLHRPGGDAGLFTEVYTCNKCNADVTMNETAATGGSHANESHSGCPKLISGKLARKAAIVVTPIPVGNKVTLANAVPSGYKGIPVPSLGNPLGVSLNFEADAELWAHELAHNRYMEHAANAGGANDAQHDHQANTFFDFGPAPGGINETIAASTSWDRACLMTYANHLATYDNNRDRRVMCGKCTLKVRGWKVETIANPGGGDHE